MTKSKIEWTESTWNPVVGCTQVSSGCQHCYAERMAERLAWMGKKNYQKVIKWEETDGEFWKASNGFADGWNNKIICDKSALDKPRHWRKPRRIFVCSMSDLFHPKVPFAFIDKVFRIIRRCPQHTFQILTKRPERMEKYINGLAQRLNGTQLVCMLNWQKWPLSNTWLGVTAENQAMADERIPILLQIPWAVRFVSIEPMLGPVDISKYFDPIKCPDCGHIDDRDGFDVCGVDEGNFFCNQCNNEIKPIVMNTIDWVIVGGESGPGARPMHPEWVRSVRDQCIVTGVPFFFKQWGEYGVLGQNQHFDVLHWRTKKKTDAYKKLYKTDCVTMGCTDGSFPTAGPIELVKRNIKIVCVSPNGEIIGDECGMPHGSVEMGWITKKKAGCLLDGKEWKQYPKG